MKLSSLHATSGIDFQAVQGFWGEKGETPFKFFGFPTGGIKVDKLSLVSEPDCARVRREVFEGNPIMPPNSSLGACTYDVC